MPSRVGPYYQYEQMQSEMLLKGLQSTSIRKVRYSSQRMEQHLYDSLL